MATPDPTTTHRGYVCKPGCKYDPFGNPPQHAHTVEGCGDPFHPYVAPPRTHNLIITDGDVRRLRNLLESSRHEWAQVGPAWKHLVESNIAEINDLLSKLPDNVR